MTPSWQPSRAQRCLCTFIRTHLCTPASTPTGVGVWLPVHRDVQVDVQRRSVRQCRRERVLGCGGMATSSRQKPPFLYVVDDDFVLPDRGDEQEGPESAVPAGDPDEAVRLFHHYRRLMAQILGYEEELPEPASEEDLAAMEEELGVALPPDLRALYGIADGDGDLVNPLFDRQEWLPL